jgi:adenylate cyclase
MLDHIIYKTISFRRYTMPKKDLSMTVLSADIANRAQLDELLGEKESKGLVKSCISYLSTIAKQHQSTIIKTVDNGLTCCFEDANYAVKAGKAMHHDLKYINVSDMPEFTPPNIRIGIHYGDVKMEGDNISGEAIKMAARLLGIAKPRQIIITKQAVDLLNQDIQTIVKHTDKVKIKGKKLELEIYDVLWENDGLSDSSKEKQNDTDLRSCLELRMRDKMIEVEKTRATVTIGRQSDNDLVVREKPVSRSHARIEYRDDRFFLVDQSSNGTLVRTDGGEMMHVIQDEVELIGNGVIGVGKKADPNLPGVIRFKLQFRSANG